MNPTLVQRLLLQKWLSERLTAIRTDELLPEADAKLPVGLRVPVQFSDEPKAPVAGWVTMPRPSKRAAVTDEGKLLAWVRENAPHQVETVWEVVVSPALIAYLAEHAPQFLREVERVTPEWVEDALKGLKDRGRIVGYQGEVHTEVPGMTVGYGASVPRVSLTDDATLIIGQAWRDGTITIPSLLALPAAGGDQ